MNTLTVKIRKIRKVLVLDINGKLEGSEGTDALEKVVNRALEKGNNQILLNLANVSSIDSSCLSRLISRHIVLNEGDGQIKLLHLPVDLISPETTNWLQTVIDFYHNEAEAIDSFNISALEIVEEKAIYFPDACYKTLPIEWGTRGMSITFRAEMMPNHSLLERTFSAKELLPSGRVTINGMQGKYVKDSFEDVCYSTR